MSPATPFERMLITGARLLPDGAVAFVGGAGGPDTKALAPLPPGKVGELTEADRAYLLKLARTTVERFLATDTLPFFPCRCDESAAPATPMTSARLLTSPSFPPNTIGLRTPVARDSCGDGVTPFSGLLKENWSIGHRASHGCLRMHRHDVEDFYPRVPVGIPVWIVK